ncbi:hypothetical protein BYT27DRAFT_7123553 [Phlegmacium glaucopus]|nr:hypothetical protein BYT27DRAFT_7123553 [Phlegmacium glaucopus]
MSIKFLSLPELERRLLRWTASSSVPRYPFFESNFSHKLASSVGGESIHDLPRWFNNIELASGDCDVPKEQYPEVAMYFLTGELKEVMLERKDLYLKETKKGFWAWEDFKEDLRRLVGEFVFMSSPQLSNIAGDVMAQLRKAHPFVASSIGLGLIIGGTAVLLPGLIAMNRKRLNTPVGMSSPQ